MILRPSFISGARRPHLSRFYVKHIQKARLYTNRTFHFSKSSTSCHLEFWALSPLLKLLHTRSPPVDVSSLLFFFFFLFIYLSIFLFLKLTSFPLGIATMKENKGKEVVDEAVKQGVQSQPRPPTSEKRKNISSRVDLGDLPSRRGREKKHKSTKP